MLTVEQVAERLAVKPATIRRWLRDKQLRGFRLGGTRLGWRVTERELTRFIRAKEAEAEL